MKKAEILSLSWEKQNNWLIKNTDDFLTLAYEDDLIGYVINFHEFLLDDYIEYPEDYLTGSLIKSVFNEISTEREQAINSGTPLSNLEKKYLKEAVIEKLNEEDEGHNGVNFTVCAIKCDDGELFVTFSGISEGPGGVIWSFNTIFATREDAIKSVSENLDEDDYLFPI